jgi:hypothetical protein
MSRQTDAARVNGKAHRRYLPLFEVVEVALW